MHHDSTDTVQSHAPKTAEAAFFFVDRHLSARRGWFWDVVPHPKAHTHFSLRHQVNTDPGAKAPKLPLADQDSRGPTSRFAVGGPDRCTNRQKLLWHVPHARDYPRSTAGANEPKPTPGAAAEVR